MKIKLLLIGKTSANWLSEGMDLYSSRLKHYIQFSMEVIPDIKNAGNLPAGKLMELEAESFLKRIDPRDDVILLDAEGKKYTSEKFAQFVGKKLLSGDKTLVFVIGGAFGFGEAIYRRAGGMLSLSEMTFSHQMVRLIYLEQLYRAFTILKGEKYHHGNSGTEKQN